MLTATRKEWAVNQPIGAFDMPASIWKNHDSKGLSSSAGPVLGTAPLTIDPTSKTRQSRPDILYSKRAFQ
jgi:hypothetical protein